LTDTPDVSLIKTLSGTKQSKINQRQSGALIIAANELLMKANRNYFISF